MTKKLMQCLLVEKQWGLFQLNGSGMTNYLKDLKPTNINDINAMVALYRPGPIAFIPDYIKRKHNPTLVKYLDLLLKNYWKQTYGILDLSR
jgi:DNA polymerase-3 subunit alpha